VESQKNNYNNDETHEMIIASGKIPCKQRKYSPESLIIPDDKDISTKQEQISEERFPDNLLELCGKYH
jgi:hypothetical protein